MDAELTACNGKVQKGKDGAPDYRYVELKFMVPVSPDSTALVGLVGTSMTVLVTERQLTMEESAGSVEALKEAALAAGGEAPPVATE